MPQRRKIIHYYGKKTYSLNWSEIHIIGYVYLKKYFTQFLEARICELEAQIKELKRERMAHEIHIRQEVCKEMQDQFVKIEDMYRWELRENSLLSKGILVHVQFLPSAWGRHDLDRLIKLTVYANALFREENHLCWNWGKHKCEPGYKCSIISLIMSHLYKSATTVMLIET